jgi:hypothetical protein
MSGPTKPKIRRSSESRRTTELGERRACASTFWRAKRDQMVRPSSPPRRVKPCQNPPSFFVHARRMSTARARASAPAPTAAPSRAPSRTTSASRTPRTTTWAHVNAIEPRWASHSPLGFGSRGAVGREGWRPRLFLQIGECHARAEPNPFPRRRARAARQTTTTRMGKSNRILQNLSAFSRARGVVTIPG